MFRLVSAFFAVALVTVPVSASYASTVLLNPTDDGSFYTCSGCTKTPSTTSYLLTAGYIRGGLKFKLPDLQHSIAGAHLSLNYYGLPAHGDGLIDVYGFGSSSGSLQYSDAFAGSYIGTWDVPLAGHGQPISYDITELLQSVDAPFLGITLVTSPGSTHVFSSLENNYGSPAQITIETADVAPIPAPASGIALVSAVLFGATVLRRRKRASPGQI